MISFPKHLHFLIAITIFCSVTYLINVSMRTYELNSKPFVSTAKCACQHHKTGVGVCLIKNTCVQLTEENQLEWKLFGPECQSIQAMRLSCRASDGPYCFNASCSSRWHFSEPLTELHAHIEAYARNNAGHTLGDEIWPIFQAMETLKTYRPNPQVLTNIKPDRLTRKMFSVLTDKYPLEIKEFVRSHGGFVCFKNFLIGWNRLGFSTGLLALRTLEERLQCLPPFYKLFYKFRGTILKRFGIKEAPRPHRPVILFMKKPAKGVDHLSEIYNLQELIDKVKLAYPFALIKVGTLYKMRNMTEQVQMLAHTDILISSPGSNVMSSLYMAEHAEVIVSCILVDGKEYYSNEITIWFQHSHVHATEFCNDTYAIGNQPVVNSTILLTLVGESLKRLTNRNIVSRYAQP